MRFQHAFLPADGTWYTPFSKWGGSLAALHPLKLAAEVAKRALTQRKIDPAALGEVVVGWTIPSLNCFYAGPWVAAMLGAERATGAIISQACATSAAALAHAAAKIESGDSAPILVVLADKTSNGPHLVYPNPMGPGGKPDAEDWVWDSFSRDPWARGSMLETAENVAREAGFTRAEQDEITLVRHQQYVDAQTDARYANIMVPVEVNPSGRKVIATVTADEGVFPTSAEGLAKLPPVAKDGTVTFGSQTHPADGNAGLIVANREQAKAWGNGDPVQILSYAQSRVEKGFMAKAVVPAARKALAEAGIGIGDVAVIKTHNPFAVNDLYFAREMELAVDKFNVGGSSLIYGHPQAPTGARLIAEGIEEARLRGGGYVLFAGCAAGDTAAAVLLKV